MGKHLDVQANERAGERKQERVGEMEKGRDWPPINPMATAQSWSVVAVDLRSESLTAGTNTRIWVPRASILRNICETQQILLGGVRERTGRGGEARTRLQLETGFLLTLWHTLRRHCPLRSVPSWGTWAGLLYLLVCRLLAPGDGKVAKLPGQGSSQLSESNS